MEEVVGGAGPGAWQRAGQRQRVVGPGAQRAQSAQRAQLRQRGQRRQRGPRRLGAQRRGAQRAAARGARRVLLHPLAQARAATATPALSPTGPPPPAPRPSLLTCGTGASRAACAPPSWAPSRWRSCPGSSPLPPCSPSGSCNAKSHVPYVVT